MADPTQQLRSLLGGASAQGTSAPNAPLSMPGEDPTGQLKSALNDQQQPSAPAQPAVPTPPLGLRPRANFPANPYDIPAWLKGGLQNTVANAGDILQGAKAAEAAALKNVNESMPYYDPTTHKWKHGRDLGDITREDAMAIPNFVISPFEGVYQHYLQPSLSGHPEKTGEYAYQNPINAAVDAWAFSPLYKGLLGKTTKALSGAATKAGEAWTTKAVEGAFGKGLQKHVLSDQILKDVLADMPEEAASNMTDREAAMKAAYLKVPKKIRPLLKAIGDRTDPILDKYLDVPQVQNYFRLQDHYNEPLWRKLYDSGYISREDVLASRWFPEWRAKVQAGLIKPPAGVNLASSAAGQAYLPQVQESLEQYAMSELKKNPARAGMGRYNPVQDQIQLERYWANRSKKLLGGVKKISSQQAVERSAEGLQKAVAAQRTKSSLQQANLGGKKVTVLANKGTSFDVLRSSLKKMEQTEKFFLLLERLEKATADLVLSPEGTQEMFSQKFMTRVMPLLKELGVDATQVAEIQEQAEYLSRLISEDGAIGKLKRWITEPGLLEGRLADAYAQSVSVQRWFTVATDAVLPFYLFIQQWLFFGTTALTKPTDIFNMLTAARIASNPDLLESLPRGVIEYRAPRWDIHHPVLQALDSYGQLGLKGINQVRGTHAIKLILDEYDAMTPLAQRFSLKALKASLDLDKRIADFQSGASKSALEGHVAKTIDDIYGKYTGDPTLIAELAHKGMFLWGRMMSHSFTLAGHIISNNPLKLKAMVSIADTARKMQEQHNAKWGKALRPSVTAGGGWVLDIPAPDGSLYVQFPGGWNLLTVALEMPYEATRIALKASGVLPDDEEQEAGLGVHNFVFNAGAILAGRMPSLTRPVLNPYQYSTDLERPNQYDLSAIHDRIADPREQQNYPWTYNGFTLLSGKEFLDQVLIMGGVGFDNKAWSYLKNMEAHYYRFRPSDKTIPFAPNMEYPKVDLKKGELLSEPGMWLENFLLGGTKLAPVTIRTQSQEAQWYENQKKQPPKMKRHQTSDVLKLTQKARKFQGMSQGLKEEGRIGFGSNTLTAPFFHPHTELAKHKG